jgi:hypothetical protein
LPSRKSRNRVRDFLFGQADERTSQQGAEGQCIPPVGDSAGQGDQILDFLTPEKALAGL